MVTPTRILGLGVEPELSNRVLRKFSQVLPPLLLRPLLLPLQNAPWLDSQSTDDLLQHGHAFMRVTFADEDGNKVMGSSAAGTMALYAR